MYLLDTSVVSNFLDEKRYYPQLTARILSQSSEQIFISVITVEEILQGALASVQKAKRKPSATKAYKHFEGERCGGCLRISRLVEELFSALNRFQILPYTLAAEKIYQSLPAKIKRIGTQDCRLAAIVHANGFIIVTVNVNDFISINLAEVEDWTK